MIRQALFAITAVALLVLPVGPASSQETVIKFGHNDPPSIEVPKHAAALYLQNEIKVLTEGKVRVDIYPAEQLGGERELLEAVMLGTVQMTSCSETVFASFVPELFVLSLPWAFINEQATFNFWDGPFGKKINDKIREKMGVEVIGYGALGFRHFTNSKRPIRTPDDMVGLKFRVREVPTEVASIRALGGDATPITWGETHSALQSGVVDGQENPVSTIVYGKLYEVQKHVSLDGHIYTTHLVVANQKFYNSLPAASRQALNLAVKNSTYVSRGFGLYYNAAGLDFLKQKGMTVTPLSVQQKQLFMKKAQPAVREIIVAKVGKPWFDEFEKALAKANDDAGGASRP